MLREDEQFVKDKIEAVGGMPQIGQAIQLVNEFRTKEYISKKGNPLVKKNARLREWQPVQEELYDLIICIFTALLAHGPMTMQALCSLHKCKIKVAELLDQIHIMASVIALISKTGMIQITKSKRGKFLMVSTRYKFREELPVIDRHGTAFHRAQVVESNYDPEQGSMLLGRTFNHHEDEICLDHINKMNSIPLCLNRRFILETEETYKKGYIKEIDSLKDAETKQQLWDIYVKRCKQKYIQLLINWNKFFLNHKYCTRGRTYATGYYLNTQGSSYKKAMIDLFHKERLNSQ